MHYFLSQFMTTIVAKKYVRFVNCGLLFTGQECAIGDGAFLKMPRPQLQS